MSGDNFSWKPPKKVEELYPVLNGMKGQDSGSVFSLNAPTAGARSNDPIPEGTASIQLYSLSTPNGQKVGILLEELADAVGLQYDAHVTRLSGDQFKKGFVDICPNSKIPAMIDKNPLDGGKPIRLFESGSMMVYLADKYGVFLPKDPRGRAECLNWVMWQMGGQGPITGSGYGHFMAYAPPSLNRDYPVARYGMEVKRLCDVLDRHLKGRAYLCGDQYTIADMICLPWFLVIRGNGYVHSSGIRTRDFLSVKQYHELNRWADTLVARPAVARGLLVTRKYPKPWLVDDRFRHLAPKL